MLSQIEWADESSAWLFVRLTLPGKFASTPPAWKYQLKRFRRSWELRFKEEAKAVWVLEWQRPCRSGASEGLGM